MAHRVMAYFCRAVYAFDMVSIRATAGARAGCRFDTVSVILREARRLKGSPQLSEILRFAPLRSE
jgi:hypothetical protein